MPGLAESRDTQPCQGCSLVAETIEVSWALDSLAAILLDSRKTRCEPAGAATRILILRPCADDGPFNDDGTSTHIDVFTTQSAYLSMQLTHVHTHVKCNAEFCNSLQSPWLWISRPQKIESGALSDSCIDLTVPWLDLCLSSHAKCSLSVSPFRDWLPTCLMDGGDEQTAPKLMESSSLMASFIVGRYVGLSHCWGKEQPLRLLGNLSAFKPEFALETLPSTFWDVVLVDSPENWAHEATLMGDVYQNAVVTIVADASENAFAGLSSSERKSEWQQRELFVDSQYYVRRFTHALYNNEREDNHPGSHAPSHDGITWVN
ncbi:hypothetical protein F5Y01DRAFT_322329 [Xylaria sp. FL0043]|nr:hypothetical protein F5Y01DRAFT_322329 [Xylaria sp. FL0043]